jgi:predicted nucleic acid-binding protein
VSGCVVDASIFGPLFFEDEEDALFAGLAQLLEEWDCLAPQHWRLELTNQIVVGLRRNRISQSDATLAIGSIAGFQIGIDEETHDRAGEIFQLATRHRLTTYDAAYLELAIRENSALASYDRDLRAAARAEGVKVFPE